jgi:toxin ParE1/3/4
VPSRLRVEISTRAERELQGIKDRIARDSAQRASAFVVEITNLILGLEIFPLRGSTVPERPLAKQGYRHLVHGEYRVIYGIEDGVVWVVRVIHGARLLKGL